MDEVIWVEVLSRHRDVAARYRCRGPFITVGRSYGNDVVIDDPHVAPAHLRIARDDTGALIAEDLGTTNGLYVDRKRERVQRVRLDGDRLLRIGSTILRVREAGQPVAPERPYRRNLRSWIAAGAIAAVIIAIELLWLWLGETADPKLSRYVSPIFGFAVVVLGWVAGWSILSRIFGGEARFERNLVVALAGVLVYSLYNEIGSFAAFSFASQTIASLHGLAVWVLIAAVSFLHLRVIGRTRLKLKAAAVTVLALAVIGVQALSRSEAQETFGQQTAFHRLMPPALRLSPVKDRAAFVAEIDAVRRRLDQDRKIEPTAPGGIFGSLFSDDD
jgi:hypothetical protein